MTSRSSAPFWGLCEDHCLMGVASRREAGIPPFEWKGIVDVPCTQHFFFFNLFLFIYLIYLFLAVLGLRCCTRARGLSLVAASEGYSLLRCAGFSLCWLLLLWSTGSRHVGSVVVAHGLSCSAACGIFPDQGLNPCPLHWQADS